MPTKREVQASLEALGILSDKLNAADLKYLGKTPAKRIQYEAQEQAALISWARLHENKYPALRFLFAIPNGGSRKGGAVEGYRLKQTGVKSGIPDLFLAAPSGEYAGLFLEMKARGGRLQQNQREWLDALNMQGYRAVCVYGFDEARAIIEDYLSGKI